MVKRKRHTGGAIYREGDSVMQMKNNYDIEWEQGRDIRKSEFLMEKWEKLKK